MLNEDEKTAKIRELGGLMSIEFGDTYRGDNPNIDRMFDLIDDLLGITGRDRCDDGLRQMELGEINDSP